MQKFVLIGTFVWLLACHCEGDRLYFDKSLSALTDGSGPLLIAQRHQLSSYLSISTVMGQNRIYPPKDDQCFVHIGSVRKNSVFLLNWRRDLWPLVGYVPLTSVRLAEGDWILSLPPLFDALLLLDLPTETDINKVHAIEASDGQGVIFCEMLSRAKKQTVKLRNIIVGRTYTIRIMDESSLPLVVGYTTIKVANTAQGSEARVNFCPGGGKGKNS